MRPGATMRLSPAAALALAVAAATILFMAAALAFAVPVASAASACTGPDGRLFGVVRIDGDRFVAQLARRTLRPLAGSLVPLPRGMTGWNFAFSPGCDAVAVTDHIRGHIQLVDLEGGRRSGRLSVGRRVFAPAMAWPRSDRLITFAGHYPGLRVVTLSVPDGRVVASHRLGGRLDATEATALGMVVLAAPRRGIGPTTLALATPDGGFLRAPLARIRGGLAWDTRRRSLGRLLVPGLAVDETAGRAYAIAANEPLVAEVDLLSGAVSYHRVVGGEDVVGPPSAAKGLSFGADRYARWLGDGTIAVSGSTMTTRRDWRRAVRRGELPTTIDPYGLRLIHTADWTTEMLHPHLRWFFEVGDALLGADAIPVTQERSTATGLVSYALDGQRRFGRFPGDERAGLWGAAWPYAYVTFRREKRTHVIDLRTGRTANVLPTVRLPVIFGAR